MTTVNSIKVNQGTMFQCVLPLLSMIMLKISFKTDPGYMRLKRSLRTLISALISATICYFSFGIFPAVVAMMAAMFTEIALYGYSKLEKLRYAAIACVSFTIAYSIGTLCNGIPLLAHTVMVIGAFFAFFLRRFGPGFMFFPLFSWVLMFLATIFKIPTETAWLGVASVAIACAIATGVNLFILPDNRLKQLSKNLDNFLESMNTVLLDVKKALKKTHAKKVITKVKLEDLQKLLNESQTIVSDLSSRKHPKSKRIENILIYQFSLFKAINLLMSNIHIIFHVKDNPTKYEAFRQNICDCLSFFSHLILHAEFIKQTLTLNFKNKSEDSEALLAKFQNALTQEKLFDNPNLIHFYNIYTAFERLWFNLNGMRQQNDT